MSSARSVYARRGLPFSPDDYPEPTRSLLRDKLLGVDELVARLPRRLRFYTTFAMSQARGLLRHLHERDDFEEIRAYMAMCLEPYPFLRSPKTTIVSAYFSPVDRLLARKMAKTVAHIPRQFIQFCDTLKQGDLVDWVFHAATPPDADGYVNLGVNCETVPECLAHFADSGQARIVLELNSHMPWVQGHGAGGYHRFHISRATYLYEHHAPLTQLPPIVPTEVEERIANHVLGFIADGDTVQLGIGGVPNYVAEHLRDRRGLSIHSEMLTDGLVDLVTAGAIRARDHEDDWPIVGTFAAGTDKLYDWLDRNPDVLLLPIRQTNDPYAIARRPRVKSINSGLMVDLHGQVASDAIGFRQVSGIGGQLEFVMGAQLSEGGRSLLCIKSTSRQHGKLASNVVVSLPPGTPVTVPRHYADVVVTEHGVAELKHLDAVERAHALVAIADPQFRPALAAEARRAGLWERRAGFERFSQRALFDNLPYARSLMSELKSHPGAKLGVIWRELRRLAQDPPSLERVRRFYETSRR